AEHAQLALGGVQETAHHREGGGLARAVGADQAVAGSALDVERDVVDRDLRAEVLADVANLDRVLAHTSLARSTRYDPERKIIANPRWAAPAAPKRCHWG